MKARRPRVRVRRAGPRDAAVLARQRTGMFRDMRPVPPAALAAIEASLRRRLAREVRRGEYAGFLCEVDGTPVSGGAVVLRRMLPRPGFRRGFLEGYVVSVYTEPGHRRRGHARRVLRAILAWCRRRGVARVALHASDAGRPLYASLGFEDSREMRLRLRGPRPGRRAVR